MKRIKIYLLLLLLAASCATPQKTTTSNRSYPQAQKSYPLPEKEPASEKEKADLPVFSAPHRELRGVWIATIANIDWPTSSSDAIDKQQRDFLQILDFYHQHQFNAVFVQIRVAGDAFYPSRLAPWSKYLTGKQGQAPKTTQDLLAWMIQEAHQRGMEFHAWLNPYRATADLNTQELSLLHDYHLHPNWMVKYGPRYYYNPGLPEVQHHMLRIVREVVENYAVDGIHFDDYFYPYKVSGEEFDDRAAFTKYGKGQSLGDWRRANINHLIQNVHEVIQQHKPWVQFGVSPFGVWRNASVDPKGSDTQAGQTNYDDLFADPLTWMRNGWVDYLVPQLYWSLDHPKASHRKLVQWWASNAYNTRIYIGNGPYKIRSDKDVAWDDIQEIPKQVALARNTPNVQGNVYFRARSLMGQNRDVAHILAQSTYAEPAIPPGKVEAPRPLFEEIKPEVQAPHFSYKGLQVSITNAYLAKTVVLYGRDKKGHWKALQSQFTDSSVDGETFVFDRHLAEELDFLAIGFLGEYGQESQVVVIPKR